MGAGPRVCVSARVRQEGGGGPHRVYVAPVGPAVDIP